MNAYAKAYLSADIDFEALFNLDLDAKADMTTKLDVKTVICEKCNGGGKFIGRTGKVLGPCFACNGLGVPKSAVTVVNDGDCAKCFGTGNWRPGYPCFACKGKGKAIVATAAVACDVSAIATAFAAAFAHGIKRPKLRLADFTFSRAPDHGRNAGAIYVKHSETADYLGKIADGKFSASMACDDASQASIVTVASDPHMAAKAYGLRTGNCSCCGRTLTNGESIDLGIGPICRGKFGW